MNPTKTEAVARFLKSKTHPDLAAIYHKGMECQVLVAQDSGERIINGKFVSYTDGIQNWWNFRIPKNAASDPVDNDGELKYDLENHVEGIGMTGWDWQQRASIWVAFDFDAIMGHSEQHQAKLSTEELKAVRDAACDIPWVTVRKSTGGAGLHLYVFFDEPVPTENHTEHAALARAILGKMSAESGLDFQSRVDICGGNMWVWHRKMRDKGLHLIKEGMPLKTVPLNWKDHLNVVKRKGTRSSATYVEPTYENLFDEICGQMDHIQIEDTHKELFRFLESRNAFHWWDADRHMLVCHTADLKAAHNELGFRGVFDTISKGTETGTDQNCFAFPLRGGAWVCRRHTRGVTESSNWIQDESGWTRAYLNKDPDLMTVARHVGAALGKDGRYEFQDGESAQKAIDALGVKIEVPMRFRAGRLCYLSEGKDGNLIFQIEKAPSDTTEGLEGFTKGEKKWFTYVSHVKANKDQQDEIAFGQDDKIRHVLSVLGDDQGWFLKNSLGLWAQEPLTHIKAYLQGVEDMNNANVSKIVGSCINRCWKLVNKPFEPEFPGDREWNKDSAKLAMAPSEGDGPFEFPTWQMIFDHVGEQLNEAVAESNWCKRHGVINGSHYLKLWVASLFQFPLKPLPYLFFYSTEQNTGKSIFHEALDLLTTKGVMRADTALSSQSGFNGELAGAILCVIEETDLQNSSTVYNRIKDWVTSPHMMIHTKNKTPYMMPNSTHWVQCSNSEDACPVFPGDTRIVTIPVSPLKPTQLIPKAKMLEKLRKEGPDFLAEILKIEVPESDDRLNLPVVESTEKRNMQKRMMNPVEAFLSDKCFPVEGASIKFGDLFTAFVDSLDPMEVDNWSKNKFTKKLPLKYPKGAAMWDGNQQHVGNISFTQQETKYTIKLNDQGRLNRREVAK